MSLRYLPPNSNLIAEVSDPLDLFDPRKNTYFLTEYSKPTASSVFKQLNALYSSYNLVLYKNTKHLLFNESAVTEEEYTAIVDWILSVPQEQRFMLAFMRRYGSNTRVCGNGIYLAHLTYVGPSPGLAMDWTWKRTTDLTQESFLQAIDAAYNSWKMHLFDHPNHMDKKWDILATNPISAPFVRLYFKFTFGTDYVGFEDYYYNAYRLATLLASDPSISLSVVMNENRRTPDIIVKRTVAANDRRALYRVYNYTTDVLTLLSYPNKEEKEKDPVLVGVELEVSTDYDIRELIDAAKDPFFVAKQDSSISGEKRNLMELVTAPSSFKYLKRQYALWFNKLDYNKFDVTTSTNNGMHVHIGRDHFEDNYHIRNFCWFYNHPAHAEFLLHISERGSMELLQRWSPLYQFSTSISRTAAFRQVYQWVGSGSFRGVTNFKGGWAQAKTVEVRLFKGIVSYASIVKNLEFVEATFHFTKGLTSYRDLTLKGFLTWLKKTPANKYTLLKKFIDQFSTDKLLYTAEVKNLVFTETNPDKIVSLLNKAPFKVTNHHLSVLNKGRKRTFVLNRDTGEISLIRRDLGKLAALDKTFAQRYLRDSEAA